VSAEEGAQRTLRPHLVAQHGTEARHQVAHGRWRALVEAVERHERLLAHKVGGVAQQVCDLWEHRGDSVPANNLAYRRQRRRHCGRAQPAGGQQVRSEGEVREARGVWRPRFAPTSGLSLFRSCCSVLTMRISRSWLSSRNKLTAR